MDIDKETLQKLFRYQDYILYYAASRERIRGAVSRGADPELIRACQAFLDAVDNLASLGFDYVDGESPEWYKRIRDFAFSD